MKDAPWYEVVFAFHNRASGDTAVTAIKAVNSQGVFVDQVGASGPLLQVSPFNFIQESAPAPQVPMYAGLDCVSFFWWDSCSGRAAAAKAQADDRRKISAEYQVRQVQYFKLAPGGSLVASAFFPASSGGIQEVVFSTKEGGKKEELRVKLSLSAPSKASE